MYDIYLHGFTIHMLASGYFNSIMKLKRRKVHIILKNIQCCAAEKIVVQCSNTKDNTV